MALASIRPTTAVVTVMIGAVEHDTVLDTVSIRSDAPEIDEIVFSNENTSGEQSVGTERFTLGFGGPLKKGAPAAVPFLPLSLYQNKAFDIDFDTDCNISGTCNFISAGPDMRAGGARRSAATARNTGAVVVSWDDGP
jgi:hypothetical protein